MHLICIFFNSNVVNYVIASRRQQFYFVFMWEPLTQFSDWTYASAEPLSCAVELCRIKAVPIHGGTNWLSLGVAQYSHCHRSSTGLRVQRAVFKQLYLHYVTVLLLLSEKKKKQKQKQIAVVFWLNFWTLLAFLISRFVQCPCCNFVSFRAWL